MTTTPLTIPCNTGDVVLVPFKFADTDDSKPRPAVIVSVQAFHDSRADAVMMALTGRQTRGYFGDCAIVDWQAAGLLMATTAKGVLRTIDRRLVHRRLGSLTATDLSRLRVSIRLILDLP